MKNLEGNNYPIFCIDFYRMWDPDEHLEDFAERTQGLAVDCYPETPDRFVEIVAIYAFLKGCHDKRAAVVAMDKKPESLKKALQYGRGAVANQKVIKLRNQKGNLWWTW